MKGYYDITVVGGGPAGTTAAWEAAKNGAHVVLFERDREIGVPVRCAEGVGEKGLAKYLEIDPQWIANRLTKFRLISPQKKAVELIPKERGLVLHRRLFDHALAEKAAGCGVEIFTKADVFKLKRYSNYTELYLNYLGREKRVKAKLVIAADGVESRIARFYGINAHLKPEDIDICIQICAGNLDIDPNLAEFWISRQWAPGGYAWVFPKGEGLANIGLGVNGIYAGKISVLQYLNNFIAENYPTAVALDTIAGGVPVALRLEKLVADGFMAVGDAGRQINPLSGGGITAAVEAGQMAGKVAAGAIRKDDTSAKQLMPYVKEWDKTTGSTYRLFYKLKERTLRMTDEEFDEIADKFQDRDPAEITLTEIFKYVFKKHPGLLLHIVKAFAGF